MDELTVESIVEFMNSNRHLRGEIITATRGQRGRPTLPDHLKKTKVGTGGKPGRPKKVQSQEEIQAAILELQGNLVTEEVSA